MGAAARNGSIGPNLQAAIAVRISDDTERDIIVDSALYRLRQTLDESAEADGVAGELHAPFRRPMVAAGRSQSRIESRHTIRDQMPGRVPTAAFRAPRCIDLHFDDLADREGAAGNVVIDFTFFGMAHVDDLVPADAAAVGDAAAAAGVEYGLVASDNESITQIDHAGDGRGAGASAASGPHPWVLIRILRSRDLPP